MGKLTYVTSFNKRCSPGKEIQTPIYDLIEGRTKENIN